MFTGWLFNVYIQKHCTYPLKNVKFFKYFWYKKLVFSLVRTAHADFMQLYNQFLNNSKKLYFCVFSNSCAT